MPLRASYGKPRARNTMILAAAILHPPLRQEASPPIALAWRSGLLCVSASVGRDLKLWMLLDTGSRVSWLGRSARDRLRAGGFKVSEDGTVELPDLALAGYSLGAQKVASEDESDRQIAGADGCLGMDVLSRYQVGLDLREKTLRLWPRGVRSLDWFTGPPESRMSLPLTERPEGWTVPVSLANLVIPMVFDTGSADTFLHTEVATLLKGARKAKGPGVALQFYDDLHRVRLYTVPNVGIGATSLGERTIGVASVPRMIGLLGRDLFGSLKILLDYPGGRATFAGLEGDPLPALEGPTVTLPSGVVLRYSKGASANAPPGCAYTLPVGYREVFRADESVDLLPAKTT